MSDDNGYAHFQSFRPAGEKELFFPEFSAKLVCIHKDGEDCIMGEGKMEQLLFESVNCYGFRHAEAVLINQDRIPKNWQKFVLVFKYDNKRVLCLYFITDGWYMGFKPLREEFSRIHRFVSS